MNKNLRKKIWDFSDRELIRHFIDLKTHVVQSFEAGNIERNLSFKRKLLEVERVIKRRKLYDTAINAYYEDTQLKRIRLWRCI